MLYANFKGMEIVFYSYGSKACIITTDSSGGAASVRSCNDMLECDVSVVSDFQSGRPARQPQCISLELGPYSAHWEQLKDKGVESCFYSSVLFACSWLSFKECDFNEDWWVILATFMY